MLAKIGNKLLAGWRWVRSELLHVNVIAKTLLVGIIAGGANAVAHAYNDGLTFAFTLQHLAVVKGKFVAGAVTAIAALFMRSPLGQKLTKEFGAGGRQ